MIYPIRRIVAGVGELNADDLVLTQGIELAKRLGAKLHLVHTFDVPPLLWDAYASIGYGPPVDLGNYNAEMQVKLEEVASAHGKLENTVYHVTGGPPAEAIRQIAVDTDADLILVGATRHGRIGRLLLGTTAQRVLRGAPLPVMVVRYPLSERPARVLITSDLSELSGGVHELGLDVLESITPGGPAAELRSLVVVAPVPLPPPLRADEVRQIALQHLEKSLSNRRPRKSAVTAVARIGEPAEEVAMEAEEWGAEYVIVGSHSRGGIERTLLGSVAESTVRTVSSANVLVVPAAAEAKRRLPVPQMSTANG